MGLTIADALRTLYKLRVIGCVQSIKSLRTVIAYIIYSDSMIDVLMFLIYVKVI